MTIADRIQALRKDRGITQEELADSVGVSRQAVSKWESEQSLPEIDKIILLSDFFETTTDYLLKGVEPARNTEKKHSAMLFSIVGTAVNAAGLLAAVFIWIERQTPYATGTGLLLMVLGTAVFLTGQFQDTQEKEKAKWAFLFPNIWILLFIPLSCAFNLLRALRHGSFGPVAPVPLFVSPVILYAVFWMVYIALCVGISGGIWQKKCRSTNSAEREKRLRRSKSTGACHCRMAGTFFRVKVFRKFSFAVSLFSCIYANIKKYEFCAQAQWFHEGWFVLC